MKRFLILSILTVFVTVSCAGTGKVRWTKPDFRQDQFEKDSEDCIEAVKDDLEQKLTVEECLGKKGYESELEPPSDKEKSKTVEVVKTVGTVFLATAGVALLVAVVAVVVANWQYTLFFLSMGK